MSKAVIYIRVEIHSGEINTTCSQVVELAKQLNMGIEFEFNDIKLYAHPDSNPQEIVNQYHKKIRKEN